MAVPTILFVTLISGVAAVIFRRILRGPCPVDDVGVYLPALGKYIQCGYADEAAAVEGAEEIVDLVTEV